MIIEQYIKEVINESKWEGISIRTVLSSLDEYKDNTWIFFDVETTGLSAHWKQLTEVAAIAVDIKDWESESEVIDTFNKKVSLDDLTKWQIRNDQEYARAEQERLAQGRERTPEEEEVYQKRRKYKDVQDVLSMTNYGGKGYTGGYDKEITVIDEFYTWVNSFPNPLLIIHNASFDMKFMAVRKGTPLERYPVIDTLKIMKYHLLPLLKTIQDSDEESKTLLSNLWVKNKAGKKFLSVSQGVLADAFNVSVDNWHTAIVDVEMLMKVFYRVYKLMEKWKDIDTSVEHGKILGKSAKSREREKARGKRGKLKLGIT